ncbi:ATP-binding protein [Kribbella ginsengisoli]|uniref:LuxR family transcriptional regulator n=1 Tax=Kribbella ginsengisoli TaxID=363865 RepID=A0ABP6Z8E8_9ACTN
MVNGAEAIVSTGLLGRQAETAQLRAVLRSAQDGQSAVLVIRGGAGVGKSAVLEHALEGTEDMRVLRALGVESEMELAFAALHQLCAPLIGKLRELPAPQRTALETVFGLKVGTPPDRFLVGLAVLSLISLAAEEQPICCAVDDAQWLDRASAQVLGFVARRLLAEPVAFLFAARQSGDELLGLPELELTGLRDSDARSLLDAVTHARLDHRIRDQLVAETRGNPLALVELPRGLTTTQLAGGLGLLTAGTLPGQIEQSFRHRVQELPESTRMLLLIAAADPVGDPTLTWRAAERLGIKVNEALDNGTDGLLTIDERIRFRHPLVRSAVYGSATAADRRTVHLALADVTDPLRDPDRRAWHLATAAAGPDESVAAELERSAERAQGRGGLAATAAFLQRAVILTSDVGRRADRAVAAARASLHAADLGAARRYAEIAAHDAQDEFQDAQALLVRSQIAFAAGLNNEALPLLLEAARQLEPFDMDFARETYLVAWGSAALIAADRDSLEEISQAVVRLPPVSGEPRPLDLVLDGCARLVTSGRAVAIPLLQKAAAAIAELPARDVLTWGWQANGVSGTIWDDEFMRSTYTREVELVRAAGALTELPIHLISLGVAITWTGDFAAADAVVGEGDLVATATGTHLAPNAKLMLSALRGKEAEAVPLITTTMEQAGAVRQLMGVTCANWAAAILYNGLARYELAVQAAQVCTSIGELWVSVWVLPELVEAADRIGDDEVARSALARLWEATEPCGTDWALGILARSRALLADDASAGALFEEAVERLGRTRLRPELARAHLLYGEWARRGGRRDVAGDRLRTAYQMFVSIGMEAFAERARRELQAMGEPVRRTTAHSSAGDDLTPQERQIALMVRAGLSNPEIGARLFLSPRTVEWHLRKVFAKLSITSRRQVREALRDAGWAPDELIDEPADDVRR